MNDDHRERQEMADVMKMHEATHRLNLERRHVVQETLDTMRLEYMMPASNLIVRQEALIKAQADTITALGALLEQMVRGTVITGELEELDPTEEGDGGDA
ncbi:MAG: hypothetical protein JXB46_02970 [Candidatus Eisenbacteria bacterium]|nr:hypothetical protein [Candidatus Eisenbacteria bacterium]